MGKEAHKMVMDDSITDYTLYWLFFFSPILKLALGCCCRVPVLPSVYCLSLAQMVKLQACIKYCEEDYSAAKVRSFNTSSVNTIPFLFSIASD